MNKYFRKIILGALIMSGVSAMNAAEKALSVELKDGQSATWLLNKKPIITFNADEVIINAENASTTYDRSEVARMSFTDENPGGVNDVISDSDIVYRYSENIFSCPGHDITVFGISGTAVAAGRDCVSLESLPAGVYIVRAAAQSFKIIKK